MLNSFSNVYNLLKKRSISISNRNLDNILKNFNFLHVSEKLNNDNNPEIYQSLKESNIMIVNQFYEENDKTESKFLIICFTNTILFINQSSLSNLFDFFSIICDTNIYFLSNTRTYFNNYIKSQLNQFDADSFFMEEITNFNKIFKIKPQLTFQENQIWEKIQSCISGLIIKQAYLKLNKNRFEYFSFKIVPREDWKENEYIELRTIGIGSSFVVKLIYLIEKAELFSIKQPHVIDPEIPKLTKREFDNYSRINHPFLPKFYGKTKNGEYALIEYINGTSLKNIKEMCLSENDKIIIILELLMVFKYLYENKFIYRDLKPNNVMIDQNKTVVLIDFDRMINNSDENKFTQNFSSYFVAPELNSDKVSYKCDIYSLGQMIYYIIEEKEPKVGKISKLTKFKDNLEFHQIYERCIDENPEKRPLITELFLTYLSSFLPRILENSIVLSYSELAFYIGYI